MLERRRWFAEFTGHALRRGYAEDLDSARAVAAEVYPAWASWDPEVAAESAFDIFAEPPGPGGMSAALH